jgi:hypothetical protein
MTFEEKINQPYVNFKAPKGSNSIGIKYISELLNNAEQNGNLTFSDEYGQLWEIKKVK